MQYSVTDLQRSAFLNNLRIISQGFAQVHSKKKKSENNKMTTLNSSLFSIWYSLVLI